MMNLDRRKFIRMTVGGAVGSVAGMHLTPLPWKLTDDIAIWTQNWPWVPSLVKGAFAQESSVCTLCPGGCGIEVRMVDDRAVKIEGRTDYPVNPGGICPIGAGGLQLLYNEEIRFTGPMKRVGPRGAGQFAPIGWAEALKELGGRISHLREQGRPEALAAVDGNHRQSTVALLIQRLLEAVGSPNYMRIPTMEDTYEMANRLMMGVEAPMAYDLQNADYILSFGCGLIEGWGAPGWLIGAWGAWHEDPKKRKGPKVVQVESRASKTASKADQWVTPAPGTETDLALGLAHVIIKEGLYRKAFVETHTHGFDAFKGMVLDHYPPEKVAETTGLKARDVVTLAKDFAMKETPVALCGKGKGGLNGSLVEFMAIQALNALAGNINQPGGVLCYDPLPLNAWPEVALDRIARKGWDAPRIDGAASGRFPFAKSLINRFPSAVLDGSGDTPVNTLLIFSANPAYTLPDCGRFRSAMEKIPYVVSFSPYKDESALMADLILPDHTHLEKTFDLVWPTGLPYPLIGLSTPVVYPPYKTKHTGDAVIELAGAVGGPVKEAFPWKDFEASLEARLQGLSDAGIGLTRKKASWEPYKNKTLKPDFKSFKDLLKKMKRSGLWYWPSHSFKNWDNIFKTPSGKFEFAAWRIQGALTAGDEKEDDTYPLVMMPYEVINLSSGWLPNPHFLNKTLFDHQLRKDESFAEINPQTARAYKVKEGDRVVISSARGAIRVRVHLFEGARPGVVYLPMGFGHTAYDEYQKGKGVNPHEIMDGKADPLSGQPAWWKTRVKIEKA